MARNFFTTFNRGELVYCSDDEQQLNKFDMRGEGLRWDVTRRSAWVEKKAAKILESVPPMCRGKPALVHTETQKDEARAQARKLPGYPALGLWMPLHGPVFAQVMHEYRIIFEEQGTPWKANMLGSRLWEILTGDRRGLEFVKSKGSLRIYLEVLGILVTSPDKPKLASLLFSMTMDTACNVNSIHLDPVLEDIFNIRTGVDGRAEVLHALLFRDQHWLPGTDAQDAENDDGSKKTSIKQFKGPNVGMRMGSSGYGKSNLRKALELASEKWPVVGDTTYTTGITKEMIDCHRQLIDEVCKSPIGGITRTFEEHLSEEYRAFERKAGTTYVCFYTKSELRARRLEDTEAVGATKNDFLARPKDLSALQNLADVAAE